METQVPQTRLVIVTAHKHLISTVEPGITIGQVYEACDEAAKTNKIIRVYLWNGTAQYIKYPTVNFSIS